MLFLILIAVALFAALSYAVTQSSRSGGGSANKETMMADISALMLIPADYRTTITRMSLGQGKAAENLDFAAPDVWSSMTPASLAYNVYHPTGGGMVYQKISPKLMADQSTTWNVSDWYISSNNEVKDIGSNGSTADVDVESVELIAFATGLQKAVCEAINEKVGIAGIPAVTNTVDYFNFKTYNSGFLEAGGGAVLGGSTSDAALAGKEQGCFTTQGEYDYYSVLLER